MAKRGNQAEHDRMVQLVASNVEEQGHSNIKSDLHRFNTPELIYWENTKKGQIPDVTSTDIRSYIFEVETDDSIDDSHTEEQWRLFSAYAQQNSKTFIVVVPKGLEQQARQRAKDLGINIDGVWEIG